METRKSEVIVTTNKLEEMRGKYLARRLFRTWQEDFLNKNTGEVVNIERSEIILNAGELIDENILSRIQFHMEAGDIKEVEVSNQHRGAVINYSHSCWPWSVTAEINGKNRKFLLYATSAHNALEITQDYIELNFNGSFEFKQVKIFDYCIFIQDSTAETSVDTEANAKYFYKIEIEIVTEDETTTPYTFVLQTTDIDAGMAVINEWISKNICEKVEKQGYEKTAFYTNVKSGTVISCFRIIEKEFSDAYIEMD